MSYIPFTPSSEGIYAGQKIKQDREEAAARLQKLLMDTQVTGDQNNRANSMLPLDMEAKRTSIDSTRQSMDLNKNKDQREAEKAGRDEDEDYGKIFPSIAAEISAYPPALARQIGEGRLGRYKKGRDMVEFLKKNNVPDDQWAEYLKKAGEAIMENNPSVRTARIGSEQRAESTRINSEAAMQRTRIDADARIAANNASNASREAVAEVRRAGIDAENERKRAHELEKIRLTADLKVQTASAIAAAKTKDPKAAKNVEELLTRTLTAIQNETDPDRRKELEAEAKKLFDIKAELSMAGRARSDTTFGTNTETGKPELRPESRVPQFPGGGTSGGWGPIKRLQ